MFKGSEQYLTDNLFRRIGYYFGDIFNKEWLDTGEGTMLVKDEAKNEVARTDDKTELNDAILLLKEQLEAKEAEIRRLHGIIDTLLKR